MWYTRFRKSEQGGDKVSFCYNKLRGKIKEMCGTNLKFAKLMGISNASTSAKLNNKSEFSQSEIFKAAEILHLEHSEIPTYFFTLSV